jgi:hypothetical protein
MTEKPETTTAEPVDTPDEAEPADQPASTPAPAEGDGGEGNQGEGPAEGDE